MEPDPRKLLEELAVARGVTLVALSRMVGRNLAYLQQYVRRGTPRVLPERERAILADFFGVEETALGAPSRSGDAEVPVPYLTVLVSAGPGAAAGTERVIRHQPIGRELLRAAGIAPADASIITVAGESMMPALTAGDRVLVDRADRRPVADGIFVVRRDDDLWIKRLLPAGRTLRLLSDHPDYPPIDLPAGEAAIVGRAKLLLRDL